MYKSAAEAVVGDRVVAGNGDRLEIIHIMWLFPNANDMVRHANITLKDSKGSVAVLKAEATTILDIQAGPNV